MPIGLPQLIRDGQQPWDRNADENMEEVRLKRPEKCPECGHMNTIIGRYYSYKRTAMYIEDVCEIGCTIKRERIKYT